MSYSAWDLFHEGFKNLNKISFLHLLDTELHLLDFELLLNLIQIMTWSQKAPSDYLINLPIPEHSSAEVAKR